MHFRLLIVLILFSSCSRQREYSITVPEVRAEYYLKALSEIGEDIERQPTDVELRKRRLFINQQLQWPEDAQSDLQVIFKWQGLDTETFHYAMDFYDKHRLFEEMLNLLARWEAPAHQSSLLLTWKVKALIGLNRINEAKHHLWQLLQVSKNDSEQLTFTARQYLAMEDTVRSLYSFHLLAQNAPQHPALQGEYVPVLLEKGRAEVAQEVLTKMSIDSSDVKSKIQLARIHYQLGDHEKAHQALSGINQESVLSMRSEWYAERFQYDDAIALLDQVILTDSSETALLQKAQILETRGWLSSAYGVFMALFEKDSTHTIAQESAQNVARKIAYLRSLKEQEEKIPVLEIRSKKATENE